MAGATIQSSIMQFIAGVLIGGAVEGVLPKRSEGASVQSQVFEVLVQAGLNGAALAAFAGQVRGSGVDLTYGIPFARALADSQPEFRRRTTALAALVTSQVSRAGLRMALPK